MLRVAVVGVALAGAGTVVGVAVARRRWAAAPDPTEGDPLGLDEGVDSVCVADDGARLAVRVLGTGTAGDVVAPHCWMGSRRFWGPVARRLVAAGHRVVLYDHRGHGDSSVGGDGLTIEALGDDLDAVLRHVDVHDAVVVGHSLGGMATQSFLVRHPGAAAERLRGVVLAATACEFRARAAQLRRTRSVFGPAMTAVYGHAVTGPLVMRRTVGRQANLGHLAALARTVAATPPEVRVELLLAMCDLDVEAALASVVLPTRVLVGECDTVTPLAQARCLAAAVPGAQLEVIPDAGHMLGWEAPDRIVAAVAELHAAAGAGGSGDGGSVREVVPPPTAEVG